MIFYRKDEEFANHIIFGEIQGSIELNVINQKHEKYPPHQSYKNA